MNPAAGNPGEASRRQPERMQLVIELQSLLAEYWASVDRAPGANPSQASFYVDAGEMVLGSLHLQGRQAIETFFTARNQREIANRRSTRHYTVNFRLQEWSRDRALVHALVIAHAGSGELPLPSEAPSAIGDFAFQCANDASAGWRLEKVTGSSVFISPAAASFAKG